MTSVATGADAEDRTGEPERIFFLHMQKTAGTSLFVALPRVVDKRNQIYPDDSDGDVVVDIPQMDIDLLLRRWAVRRDEIRIVTGHLPLCTTELLGVPFRTMTVLRDPVERTLSYLRHHRELTPEDRDKPLEAIYEDPFRFHGLIHNHMVKMLSLTTDEMTAGMLTRVDFTDEHLERAKANLAAIDVVGIQERFEQFWADLEHTFGWDLGPVEHANRTRPVEVSDAFRERIAADNALDQELYEYAVELVSRRAATTS